MTDHFKNQEIRMLEEIRFDVNPGEGCAHKNRDAASRTEKVTMRNELVVNAPANRLSHDPTDQVGKELYAKIGYLEAQKQKLIRMLGVIEHAISLVESSETRFSLEEQSKKIDEAIANVDQLNSQ